MDLEMPSSPAPPHRPYRSGRTKLAHTQCPPGSRHPKRFILDGPRSWLSHGIDVYFDGGIFNTLKSLNDVVAQINPRPRA